MPVAAGTNLSNFVTTNIGSMQNQGIEFSLSARVLEAKRAGPGLDRRLHRGHNTNKLLSITPFGGQAQQILVGGIAGGVGTTIQVLSPASRSTRSSSSAQAGCDRFGER